MTAIPDYVSVIEAVRTYLATYSGLPSGAPVWVNFLSETMVSFSVVPLPGQRVVESYIDGTDVYEFPFAFQSIESTADEAARLAVGAFYEAFALWLDTQSEAGSLPTLGAKQKPTQIEATNWAFLSEQGGSGTGIYQIQCKLTYEQKP